MNQYTGVSPNKEPLDVLANSFESALRLYRELSLGVDPVEMYISKQNVRVADDVIDPTFTVTVNEPAFGAVYPSSGSISAGSELLLTAVPADGHTFTSWSVAGGAPVVDNPLRLVVSENTAIQAVFA